MGRMTIYYGFMTFMAALATGGLATILTMNEGRVETVRAVLLVKVLLLALLFSTIVVAAVLLIEPWTAQLRQ